MNLNNAIYFIQDLENTGKKRIKFLIHKSWRTESTEKVIGKKYQSGPIASALLSCHVREANCHASKQTNVPPFMGFLFGQILTDVFLDNQ